MTEFIYDGPSDSDEEIEDMASLKTDWEMGIKFSKNGIKDAIEKFIEKESVQNDPRWEQKLRNPGLAYFLKKGGSELST